MGNGLWHHCDVGCFAHQLPERKLGAVFGALAEGEVAGGEVLLLPPVFIATITAAATAVAAALMSNQIRFMRVAMAPTSGRQYARATGEAAPGLQHAAGR
ncbi:hypothetical protein [Streptomyces sp. NPDC001401]|uniref:hypothetical protein n=1 Tax=Streptomyces sp. NPDC001401 TaxID=3364570 RepID=UPI00368259F2